MKKSFVMLLSGALLCGSLAFATPTALSPTQLDTVVAGQGIFDYIFSANQVAPTDQSAIEAEADNNAIAGTDANSGNIAGTNAENSNAIAGAGNLNADIDVGKINLAANGSVAAMDNAVVTTNELEAEEGGLIALDGGTNNKLDAEAGGIIAANNSQVYVTEFSAEEGGLIGTDSACVADVDAEEGGNAAANGSTITETDIDVEVSIEDSFNVVTNTLTVSGQGTATAIVLANSLGEQNINSQIVTTNAASNMPTNTNLEGGTIDVPAATAISNVCQIGINGSFILGAAFCSDFSFGGADVVPAQ